MTSTATDLTVAAWPGCAPRLLRLAQAAAEDFAEYAQAGGYRRVIDADALLGQVDLSGLLGRGGAAFPMGTKLRTVRDAGRRGVDTVVVANGEEGEPASVKDRWLLRNRPHLVLDGLRIASAIVGASRAYVYVSDQQSATAVAGALGELKPETFGATAVTVVTVEPDLRGRRGNGRRPPNQRRTGETDRQAAPTLRAGSVGTSDDGEQRRDAGQPALHP